MNEIIANDSQIKYTLNNCSYEVLVADVVVAIALELAIVCGVCLSVHVRIIVCYTYEHLPIYNGMLVTAHFAVFFLCIYSSFICFVVFLYLFFLLIMWTGQRQKFWNCFYFIFCVSTALVAMWCSLPVSVSLSLHVRVVEMYGVQSNAREYRTIVVPRNCALFIYFFIFYVSKSYRRVRSCLVIVIVWSLVVLVCIAF